VRGLAGEAFPQGRFPQIGSTLLRLIDQFSISLTLASVMKIGRGGSQTRPYTAFRVVRCLSLREATRHSVAQSMIF